MHEDDDRDPAFDAAREEALVRDLASWVRENHPGCVLTTEVMHDEDSGEPEVYLDTLEVPARGRGVGSAIMAHVCRLADERGVRLTSNPTAIAEVPLDKLVAFNERFGFVRRPGDVFLTRAPGGRAREHEDPEPEEGSPALRR